MTFDYFPGAFWARDDITYANGAGWGPNFVMHSGSTGRIGSGKLHVRALGSGSGKVAEWAEWKFRPNATDDVESRFMLTAPTLYAQATDNEFVLAHRASETANAINYGVWLVIFSGTAHIYSVINNTQASRAGPVSVDLRGVPLLFSSKANLHQLIRLDTGATVVGWNDSGGLAAKGAGFRTIRQTHTANFPIFQQQFGSPVLEYFEATAA
ncbi:hypothetical protein [Nocardia phage NBR1]|uniref:virion structural protein n=1 Tax=Nocardia phage NBR1 TaxID=1109711 RepID=UPI00023EEDD6|nr:virion structural protein [Nocardia phage NBR1]AEV52232.1 hypothetical protein [Nocardia phage NBR1]